MNIAKYDDFILNLDVELPPYEEFIKIADMTALHESEINQFIQSLNFQRKTWKSIILSHVQDVTPHQYKYP